MITSVIRHRVADFLKQYAPFDGISQADLLELAGSGRVKFHESEELLFSPGDKLGNLLWVIQQGKVEIWEDDQLRDLLGPGDIPGLEALAGAPLQRTARTGADVILYGISAALFLSLLPRYASLQSFLSAQLAFTSGPGRERRSWLDTDLPPLDFLRARLLALPMNLPSREAAARLLNADSGIAALVDSTGRAVGAVTPRELMGAPEGPVASAASGELPVLPFESGTRSLIREMLRTRGEHIALTRNGAADSDLEALITASDLALFCGHNPARLIRGIRNASSPSEIAPLLKQCIRSAREAVAQPGDVDDSRAIAVEITAALCEAALRLAAREIENERIPVSAVPHVWVLFGAAARGDSLEAKLPTLAVIFDDEAENFSAADRIYFTALAGRVYSLLHSSGLPSDSWQWPSGAASSMPLSEWKRFYSETLRRPLEHDLYARREFFDIAPLSGSFRLLEQAQFHLTHELHASELALPLLANDTLSAMPPLTFFAGAVLDSEGHSYESLDLETAMLHPLANAARVFSLAKQRLSPAGTLARLETAALAFPAHAPHLRAAANAFRIALCYRALCAGNIIVPNELSKYDQLVLKGGFASIQRFLEFTADTFVAARP